MQRSSLVEDHCWHQRWLLLLKFGVLAEDYSQLVLAEDYSQLVLAAVVTEAEAVTETGVDTETEVEAVTVATAEGFP